MSAARPVSPEAIVDLLRRAAPSRSETLDQLFARIQPTFLLDSETERIHFRADSSANAITIGSKCICRLQAYAYASGIVLCVQGNRHGAKASAAIRMDYSLANPLLTWAVARDLYEWSGQVVRVDELFDGSSVYPPANCLSGLAEQQRIIGHGLFHRAMAFVLLHELAHLHNQHTRRSGYDSYEQEKEADRFAADWLVDSRDESAAHRLNCLLGISVALLWETIYNIFFGPRRSDTHPEGYDRLFNVLDSTSDLINDDAAHIVWWHVDCMLYGHMGAAGIQVETLPENATPREIANHLINEFARSQK